MISILFIVAVSNISMARRVGAHTTTLCEMKAKVKQLEDELENLDKKLAVLMACPDEVDLNQNITVMIMGVRVGKAVSVKPISAKVRLLDATGFLMAERKLNFASDDEERYVVNAYNNKTFYTELPALETAGNYKVSGEMSYIAPWGEEITGVYEKSVSCQSWFNISSILDDQRTATKQTLENVMGGAADIVRDLAKKVQSVATGLVDFSAFLGKFRTVGTIDPTAMTFFPIYLDNYHTGQVGISGKNGIDGTALDPDSHFNAFVDSLDVLVQKGLPFSVYTITDIEQLKQFGYAYNGTSTNVNDANPLHSGYYLSYDPSKGHAPSDWTSGQGRMGGGGMDEIDITKPLPYRNILVNMYENWFPIPDDWNDYTNTINRSTVEIVNSVNGNRNGSRWIKHIGIGMDRNASLFYNVLGQPMNNFFDAESGDANPDITDFNGLEKFNDFTILTKNHTLGQFFPLHPINPNTHDDVGGILDFQLSDGIHAYKGVTTVLEGGEETVDIDGSGGWIQSFFDNNINYHESQYIPENAFMIENTFLEQNDYGQNENYSSGIGMVLSPSAGLGYTSIENVTYGFEMLHGMYYKIVGDAVFLARDKLLSASESVMEEGTEEAITVANEMLDIRQQLKDAWGGNPSIGQEKLDLVKINDLFMELDSKAFNVQGLTSIGEGGTPDTTNVTGDWFKFGFNSMYNNSMEGANVTKTAFNASVEIDQALETAGSDLNFGFFGDIWNGLAKIGGGIANGAANLVGAAGRGICGAISLIPGVNFLGSTAEEHLSAAASHLGNAGTAGGEILEGSSDALTTTVKAIIKGLLKSIMNLINQRFQAIGQLVTQLDTFRQNVITAIQDTINLIANFIQKTADALEAIADAIDNIVEFINDFVDMTFDLLINTTQTIQNTMSNIKTDILQQTGFFFQVEDSLYKMVSKSEFASGILRYASEEFGITDEVFFKELDVLRPLALLQSGDTGLYVTQMGNEIIDEVFYVVHYKGQLVDPTNGIRATYQYPSPVSGEINMTVTKAVDDEDGPVEGLYIGDTALLTERDWKTFAEVEHVNDVGKPIKSFIVERTTKVEPSLQPDAYPKIQFDPNTLQLRTGENYLMKIGVDNLMYSKPNVTVRAELISNLGLIVGIREDILELNPEGEDPKFIDLQASLPFYVPPGTYTLVVKIVEDNGDVTRVAYSVNVASDNFIFALIGTILSLLGVGVVFTKIKKQRKNRDDKKLILTGRNDFTRCTDNDFKTGRCMIVQKCDPSDINCRF